MFDDPRSADPRDDERDPREIDVRWVSLDNDPADTHDIDSRDREPGERDRDRDTTDREHDPRDAFIHDLELPRDRDRELSDINGGQRSGKRATLKAASHG